MAKTEKTHMYLTRPILADVARVVEQTGLSRSHVVRGLMAMALGDTSDWADPAWREHLQELGDLDG